ncbi:MAG: malate synthase A, partial [Myxococcales bacterium]|nr:malate synthase A [Myxococcales bacterium]
HRADPAFVLPDRGEVGMTRPFLAAYTRRVVEACHRRGAHAMGGMAAQIPIKADPEANAAALAKVRGDKVREARLGHDGTWVAHPGLVPIAKEVFDEYMPAENQLDRPLSGETITEAQMLEVPDGTRTRAGLEQNVRVGLLYLESWLGGRGCVPIDHLMEDAATAEISRAQLWQWSHHDGALDDGTPVTPELVRDLVRDITRDLAAQCSRGSHHFIEAGALFEEISLASPLVPFLTVPAYALISTKPSNHDASPEPRQPSQENTL